MVIIIIIISISFLFIFLNPSLHTLYETRPISDKNKVYVDNFDFIEFSPDCQRILYKNYPYSINPNVEIWNITTNSLDLILCTGKANTLDWSLDGSTIAIGKYSKIEVFDANTGEKKGVFETQLYQTPGFEFVLLIVCFIIFSLLKRIDNKK